MRGRFRLKEGFGKWLRDLWRGAGPLPEDLLAQDNGKYVASARGIALLLVAVGALSGQLGYEESQRRAAAELYGYLEKVLVVGEAVAAGELALAAGESAAAGAGQAAVAAGELVADGGEKRGPSVGIPGGWRPMLDAMAGDAHRPVRVDVEGMGPEFATVGDATGRCPVTVWRYVASDEASDARVALAVMRPSQWEHMPEQAVAFENLFLVRLGFGCVPMWKERAEYLVAKLGDDDEDFALVLEDRVYERLKVVWFRYRVNSRMTLQDVEDREAVRSAVFGEFLTGAQLGRLDGYAYPFLKASHRGFLQELVLEHAVEATGRSYGAKEWRQATRDMAAAVLEPTGLWGFAFERQIAARAATLVVLALSASFLYRVRRLNPGRDLRDEPWGVLQPWGRAEVLGAAFWALVTVLGVAAVGWALRVYEGDVVEVGAVGQMKIADGKDISYAEQAWLLIAAPLVWGGIAVIAAEGFLLLGWCRVFKVARAARRRLSAGEPAGAGIGKRVAV